MKNLFLWRPDFQKQSWRPHPSSPNIFTIVFFSAMDPRVMITKITIKTNLQDWKLIIGTIWTPNRSKTDKKNHPKIVKNQVCSVNEGKIFSVNHGKKGAASFKKSSENLNENGVKTSTVFTWSTRTILLIGLSFGANFLMYVIDNHLKGSPDWN